VTIEFRCSCGAVCRAQEAEAGRLHHCEACGLDVPVPSPEEAQTTLQADATGPDPSDAVPETGDAVAGADTAEGEPAPDAGSGLDALRHQIVTDEDAAQAAEEAQAHQEAADALRDQLGGGGIGDIAAHLRDGEDADIQADADAQADKRRGDAEALRQQLGGGGVADIVAAFRGEDAGEDAGEDVGEAGPAAGEGPAIDTAALGAAALRRPPAKKKVLRGYDRAAHHITFKRVIWMPAMLVGLVCLGIAVYCFVPKSDPVYEQHRGRFHEKLKAANIPVNGFEIVKHGGELWAVPKGADARKTDTGRVYYTNAAGFDEPAVNAEDYALSQMAEEGRASGLFTYGLLLGGVGLVLMVLSLITVRDVRMVAAAEAKRTPVAEEAEDETDDESVSEGEAFEDETDDESVPEDEAFEDETDDESVPEDEADDESEDEADEDEADDESEDEADANPESGPADNLTDEEPSGSGAGG